MDLDWWRLKLVHWRPVNLVRPPVFVNLVRKHLLHGADEACDWWLGLKVVEKIVHSSKKAFDKSLPSKKSEWIRHEVATPVQTQSSEFSYISDTSDQLLTSKFDHKVNITVQHVLGSKSRPFPRTAVYEACQRIESSFLQIFWSLNVHRRAPEPERPRNWNFTASKEIFRSNLKKVIK